MCEWELEGKGKKASELMRSSFPCICSTVLLPHLSITSNSRDVKISAGNTCEDNRLTSILST